MVEICPLYAQSLQYFYHEGMLDRDKDFSASNEIMCIFHIIMGVCFPSLRDLFLSIVCLCFPGLLYRIYLFSF